MKVTLDIHGMVEYDAIKYLQQYIAKNQNVKEIIVVHGSNGGTILRDMVRNKKKLTSKRIVSRVQGLHNDGETILILK